ncbi:pentapeptide repeat-containing protein [Pseudobacteriovorax antillogorgiicola]|uniref:Pentapeptide repeat-containing protein n=1 Tax=Pseudobacteriovorax antillogorgiicola TaxID=1513793 RepID=A0A1Y6BEB4_9BACT|nr:pentapeptide repeat-containing protein [Pseudobacteriovorax antillogorgiicola]TCS57289.1 pentapeptide repeat protein [Pseudobacteriovorax antillogorgiicola]SMF03016.1 Pentapeptide repeat-containing protein [Pseudobacteriovorax antillogorgiicola]
MALGRGTTLAINLQCWALIALLPACDHSTFKSPKADVVASSEVKNSEVTEVPEPNPILEESSNVPSNITGAYLSSNIGQEIDGSLSVTTTLMSETARLPYDLEPGVELRWAWNVSQEPSNVIQSGSQVTVFFTDASNSTYQNLLNMELIAIKTDIDGLETSLSGYVRDTMKGLDFSNGRFSLAPTDFDVTISTSFNPPSGGSLLVARSLPGQIPFLPKNGDSYTDAIDGIIFLGLSNSIFDDSVNSETIYSYQFWGVSAELRYELLGEWKTFPGSTVGESFDGYDFSNASLIDVDWEGSRFTGGSFEGADMRNNTLRRARYEAVSFQGTDLRNSDLTDAELINCNLDGANLTGATWTDGRICGPGSIGDCL